MERASRGWAPSPKGKHQKKVPPAMEEESVCQPGAADAAAPDAEENPGPTDPTAQAASGSEGEQRDPAGELGEDTALSGEKEEEQAFLVGLYKFMKERRTPIERIPHLGFKQINLWKIYKAVEKLGAYELVTGRRLWKNVYDELGGSPGSTSAATCTRRHYERLVLPYVRHLKGEDDKPLPPTKPRKQYKVSKELRTKKEKSRQQIPLEKTKLDAASTPQPGREVVLEQNQPRDPSEVAQPPTNCHGHCEALGCSEAYQRLFSSFYFKGNHPIMSPLAKKKLLAQVSKAEALHCPEGHCREGWMSTGPCHSPDHSAAKPQRREDGWSPGPQRDDTVDPAHSCPPSTNGGALSPQAEEGSLGRRLSPVPTTFTGCFRAYRGEVLKPMSCRPLRAPAGFPDASFLRQPPSKDPPLLDHPRGELREPLEGTGFRQGSKALAFPASKACWVAPITSLARVSPQPSKSGQSPGLGKRGPEDGSFGPGKKLRAVSPFVREAEPREASPGLAKPQAMAPGFPTLLPPPGPDAYTGTMLRFPLSLTGSRESSPLAPSLSPFVIPAFPGPVITASAQASELCRPLATSLAHYPTSYDSSQRHRLYPVATWHSQPAYASPHGFHRPTKL
ncbi:AT-rich interactive domain-containing protein 5A [Alligator sinensis]|uniref:AT-rich interactive domain-containing protein 5A n=1 Tax=Alligator sinensis TaxID=38654 RepID=A0A1U7SG79_ALLSI|nr:AT-rich interactive domain-containing protein 5A [Alligator sinensis]